MSELIDGGTQEKLTVDEWLDRLDKLGYFITKPTRVYETKGWKSVIEFAALLICLGLLLGGGMGGAMFAAQYYDCGEKHGK